MEFVRRDFSRIIQRRFPPPFQVQRLRTLDRLLREGKGGDNSAISPSIEAGERNLTSSEDGQEGRGRRTRTDKRVIESGAEAISDKAMNNSK